MTNKDQKEKVRLYKETFKQGFPCDIPNSEKGRDEELRRQAYPNFGRRHPYDIKCYTENHERVTLRYGNFFRHYVTNLREMVGYEGAVNFSKIDDKGMKYELEAIKRGGDERRELKDSSQELSLLKRKNEDLFQEIEKAKEEIDNSGKDVVSRLDSVLDTVISDRESYRPANPLSFPNFSDHYTNRINNFSKQIRGELVNPIGRIDRRVKKILENKHRINTLNEKLDDIINANTIPSAYRRLPYIMGIVSPEELDLVRTVGKRTTINLENTRRVIEFGRYIVNALESREFHRVQLVGDFRYHKYVNGSLEREGKGEGFWGRFWYGSYDPRVVDFILDEEVKK
ncbi:hypothetical protein HOD05_04490 [Candidatus Woesearchaeota archaeon]|jgi:hypothetical protein|nr:hypothetical protein [Candidatus Woesearchaeota archaeon]MBT4150416.1 hypothetical protein [Candidatus Woesearchaeota archaeon]MBT4247509.1 hypothetical protein [Candidatus Woesearchaeota archaeon]MBT4434452.1 hypothetical protein [Candidatus Woesearchaeota archaeon]MBT7331694.1 hypothetical protein [Candidatus Woesearchaeota archaeon]